MFSLRGRFWMPWFAGIIFLWPVMGQNLLPNPDFETNTHCPNGPGNGNPSDMPPWQDATLGTCDYFSECATSVFAKVPKNNFGYQYAHSGLAYAGLYAHATNSEYREYLQAPLNMTLMGGEYYYFSMYFSLADKTCAANHIGAYFSATPPMYSGNDGNDHIDAVPQVYNLVEYYRDTMNWVELSGCFVAQGDEQYVTIGNFYSDAETVLDPDCTLSLTASYYYIDDVSLEQIAPPDPIEVELGGSVSSCVQYVIDPGIPNVQYTWDDGSHADTLLVTESGFHYVSVTDGCATGYGTVDVTITGLDDPVEIGVDEVTICEGETYTISLDPGAGTYTWSNGFSGSVIGITEPGLYVVTMSDEGCDFSTDQIQVMVIAPPAPFTLGPDTTICPGGEIDYAFDPVQGDFLWSNGSTSPEFTISNAGNYSLDISNACFDVEDEIVVSILEPPDLGLSTVPVPLCEGDILIIDLDPSLGHYLWQDGSTEYHYIITDPGDYTVSVTNVCDTYEGYLSVVGSQDPNPDLGPDTTLCASQLPYLLDVSLADGESYLWQDGSQADHFLVNTEGNYRVTVTNGCGEVTDEVQVSVLSSILSVILPPDQLLCPGDSFIITASADPGQYLWQDQSTADTLVAHSAGVYVLTVNNSCATGMDSMAIQYLPVLGLPDLGPDLALCPGEQLILTTGISGGSYLWQDGSTSDNFLVTNPGTYSVKVSDQCAVAFDTIQIISNDQPPVVDLPSSLTLCTGDSLVVNPGITGVHYLWNDQSQNNLLIIHSPGEYSLTVSNACGMDSDSILVLDGGNSPAIALGNDFAICPGDTVTLTPVQAGVISWLWNNGDTTSTYEITQSGVVTVEGKNFCGIAHDTLLVTMLPPVPLLDLGPDTSLCPGSSLSLTIAFQDVQVDWSTGAIDTQILVTTPGLYTATISNACGTSLDSIIIHPLPDVPDLNLGSDLSLCPGDHIVIDPGISDVSYLWQDGSTGSIYDITLPGDVILSVSNSCGSASDTLSVEASLEGPQLNLGPDITACSGESIILNANLAGVNYQWQDGSNGASFITTNSGTFILQVSNSCGLDIDSIDVDFLDPPMPFSLGADTILCPGESVLLVAPGGGFMNQWQDGSSAPTYLADQPGTYSLQIQNQCGIAYDEMSLDFDQQIPVVQFDPVLFICPDQVIELDATQSFPVIYLWSTGSNEPSIQVKSPGQYAVSVQTPCVTIPAQTEVAISDTCNVAIAFYIPNVFSPDGDGINDVFSIFPSAGTDVTHLACSVFDRWGNLVFSSSSYPFEWPGDFNGQKLDPGVYAYRVIITYMDHSTERQVTRSGDITLVR